MRKKTTKKTVKKVEIRVSKEAELTLLGIREVLAICDKNGLPYVIPALSETPLSLFHARSLAILSDKFGDGFSRYCSKVTQAFIAAMSTGDEKQNEKFKVAADRVVLNITEESVPTLMEELTGPITQLKGPKIRWACAHLIGAFCQGTQCDFSFHYNQLIQSLLLLFIAEETKLQIGRAVQQECRDRSRMPSSA
eukprot:TRINITY_DN29138_c0_g1_i2.p1 TRINITY_DN29138_c0_g1~~TRINITY_DN29138_c0_g1_i2.p1  ORF type:complete len:194 (-),score=43.10 TRINITY_DN29138_c0_g1_i2:11-592(-)